jgi:hypothetical protein
MDKKKLYGRICLALVVVAVVNFISYSVVGAMIGGEALNGKSDGGHYFLFDHGKLTEVSHAVFIYSWIHGASMFVTQVVGALALLTAWRLGLLGFTRRK